MASEPRPPKLGRGLAALLGTGPADEVKSVPASAGPLQRRVPLEHVRPNPHNPRRSFVEADLAELANSIRARGVLQPIVVRTVDGASGYEIIAGERRWRAAQRAGVHDVPVVIIEADDKLALELAIIENVQRSDLNAAEEARGYRKLISDHGYSTADLAVAIGKSRSHVANTLRLLGLPDPVLTMLESGKLSAGHARALLAVPEPEKVAADVLKRHLSVRDVEKLTTPRKPSVVSDAPVARSSDTDARAISKKLTVQTGLKIGVTLQGDGGRVTIDYKTLEQFDHIYRKLSEL